MKLELKKSHVDTKSNKSSTLVVFSSVSKQGDKNVVKISSKEIAKLLGSAIEDKSITGKSQECVLFRHQNWNGFKNILVVGCGAKLDAEQARSLASTVLSGGNSAGI